MGTGNTEHTPWKIKEVGGLYDIQDNRGEWILTAGAFPTNAAHIVKCVNLHDELVEALSDLLGDLPSIQNGKCVHCGRDYTGDEDLEGSDCPSNDCPSYKARAILAKARSVSEAI